MTRLDIQMIRRTLNNYFIIIFNILLQNMTESKVGSYKDGLIARVSQTDTRTTLKDQNRSTTLERSVIENRGRHKLVLPDPNPRPLLLQWFETFGPHEVS